jgi:hypothetical protein
MRREWHFDPIKLVLAGAAIVAALTQHYTAGIILAALAGTSGLTITWRGR